MPRLADYLDVVFLSPMWPGSHHTRSLSQNPGSQHHVNIGEIWTKRLTNFVNYDLLCAHGSTTCFVCWFILQITPKELKKKSNCVLFRLQALERWLLWPLTYPVCSQLATGLNKSGIWNRSWKSSWEYHFDGCQVQTPVSTGMMVIGVSKWKWGCVAVLQYNEYRCATLGTKHLVFIVRHLSRY